MSQEKPNGLQDDVREIGGRLTPAEWERVSAVLDAIDAASGPTELGVYMTGLGDAMRTRFLPALDGEPVDLAAVITDPCRAPAV